MTPDELRAERQQLLVRLGEIDTALAMADRSAHSLHTPLISWRAKRDYHKEALEKLAMSRPALVEKGFKITGNLTKVAELMGISRTTAHSDNDAAVAQRRRRKLDALLRSEGWKVSDYLAVPAHGRVLLSLSDQESPRAARLNAASSLLNVLNKHAVSFYLTDTDLPWGKRLDHVADGGELDVWI
ncbi:hypothetical protein [Streptomyces qinglanensis]|uniref:hypothetical protein n=1 Tax=Streptomyces qinglanensis TaxID=943816 RepID=UPI003D71B3A3